jgi:hypothetical protein
VAGGKAFRKEFLHGAKASWGSGGHGAGKELTA